MSPLFVAVVVVAGGIVLTTPALLALGVVRLAHAVLHHSGQLGADTGPGTDDDLLAQCEQLRNHTPTHRREEPK